MHCTLSIKASILVGHEFLLCEYLPRRISGVEMELSFSRTSDDILQKQKEKNVLLDLIGEIEALHSLNNVLLIKQSFSAWQNTENIFLAIMNDHDITRAAEIWESLCEKLGEEEEASYSLEHHRTIQTARAILHEKGKKLATRKKRQRVY